MSDCARCPNETHYPHVAEIDGQWYFVCDDCNELIADEHSRDLAEREYEEEVSA